jgi:hypothetical protein
MNEEFMEVFSLLGAPARVFGRLPLVTRYLWNGFHTSWPNPEYALARYGKHYRLRPWLLFDVKELEMVEDLINRGSDENVLAFRMNQLNSSQMVAIIVGASLLLQIHQ